ncbi:DNA polymerase V [Variovorax sp. EL159]|nr:translesion error-prone DNA polymerase V autoproteolytic subunit [Variovorax sp. EL159]SCX53304.1 DNA polymerase V [Variovorax sp. EL159]SCX53331.1 DNA polymerase V [Variovorax sp. EL159]
MNSVLAQSVPVALSTEVLMLPIADARVHAGFPSPAEDFLVKRIDLNTVLVTHPQATFFLRVAGDSMRELGIEDGDLLVVNRAIKPRHGQIVVAVVDGDFAVKQLHLRAGRLKLKAGNPTYPDITPSDGQVVEVWGVVTSCIKQFQT